MCTSGVLKCRPCGKECYCYEEEEDEEEEEEEEEEMMSISLAEYRLIISERDDARESLNEKKTIIGLLERSRSSYKGVNTRLTNQVTKLRSELQDKSDQVTSLKKETTLLYRDNIRLMSEPTLLHPDGFSFEDEKEEEEEESPRMSPVDFIYNARFEYEKEKTRDLYDARCEYERVYEKEYKREDTSSDGPQFLLSRKYNPETGVMTCGLNMTSEKIYTIVDRFGSDYLQVEESGRPETRQHYQRIALHTYICTKTNILLFGHARQRNIARMVASGESIYTNHHVVM